jgi:hypothetical protein
MFKAKVHVVWRKKKKLLVLLDTKSGSYFTLNNTGQDLWMKHIVNDQPISEVIKEISAKYTNSPGEAQILSDCEKLIASWKSNDLIEEKILG